MHNGEISTVRRIGIRWKKNEVTKGISINLPSKNEMKRNRRNGKKEKEMRNTTI
jgi:hypothetical protein